MTGLDAGQETGSPAPLRCPRCSSDLLPEDGFLVCNACARRYPVDQGIVDLRLVDEGAPACGSAEALPVIEAATPEGWTDAVGEFLRGRDDALDRLDALTAERRQAWKIFLDLMPGRRLLCLGVGTGSVAQSLAPHAEQIHVLEQDIGKLRFARQRLAIFRPDDDIILLAGGGAGRLPFAADSFDGVILAESPELDVSARLLGEIRRVLHGEGQVLVLADNRFSLSLSAGWWDRWSPAFKPLPQLARAVGLLAGWWQKRSGPQSLPGLCRRLASAGFTELEAFGLWPGRSQLDEVIPLQSDRSSALPKEALSLKARLRRQGIFLPAHCIVAQAGGARRHSTYERLLTAAAHEMAEDRDPVPLRAVRHLLTRKDKMAILAQCDDESLVLRIPFGPAAAAAEERHVAMIAHLAESHPGIAPRPLAGGRVDGIDYRVESALPGISLTKHLRERGPIDHLERVSALLDVLNPEASLRRGSFEGAPYESMVEARLERLFLVFRDQGRQAQLRAFFRSQLYGASLPFGLLHGDFSNSNIYLANEKIGIIDWEAAALDDLPILDPINYLESSQRPAIPGYSLAEGLYALASRKFPTAAEERFLFDRYERLGIDVGCHAGLVYLAWLRALDYLLPYWLRYHPDGQQRYIHQVVQVLLSRASTL